MEYSSDQACCFQLLDLSCNELLTLHCLFSDSLLDGPRVRTDDKVVLNYFPGNTGDVRWLPCKHIDIRPQEGDERPFLFAVEGGAYSESSARVVLLNGHLLGLRWCSFGFLALAGGALWHVLDWTTTLRRGALAGVGVRGLADLLSCRALAAGASALAAVVATASL